MTVLQLNVAVQRELSYLSDNETLLQQVLKYLKQIRRENKNKALEREKEEIKADLRQRIEELKQAREGKIKLQSADDFLKELREA